MRSIFKNGVILQVGSHNIHHDVQVNAELDTEIDFSDVKEEERRRNYKPHGGGMKIPESSEREFQERHEAGTLMVIYTHPSDIPSSPREPGDPFSGVVTETVDIGQPLEETLVSVQNSALR